MSLLSNSFALLIGVGDDLPASARDAQSLYDFFKDSRYAGYPEENLFLLKNEEASREGMIKALDQLIEKTNENSSVVIFYSGHGGTYTDNDIIELEHEEGTPLKPESENRSHFYWVPNGFNPKKYKETWFLATELKEKLSSLKTRRLVMFLDCCHAEGMTQNAQITVSENEQNLKSRLDNPEGLVHRIDNGKGISILSSCRADELSWIIPKDAHNSLFTSCLLKVLKAEHKDNFEHPVVRMTDVIYYTMKRVPEIKDIQRPFVNLQMYDNFALSHVHKNNSQGSSHLGTSEQLSQKEKNAEVVSEFRENHGVNAALFVHGFSGQAHESFGVIPDLLASDEHMKGWDLFPLGYSEEHTPELGNDIYASAIDIDTLAHNIVSSLIHRFSDYKRISLISHSVGGLAVQKALVQISENILSKISHVILFACPNMGIQSKEQLAKLGERAESLKSDGAFINEIRSQWDQKFKNSYPFNIRAVAGTKDSIFSLESCHQPFSKSKRVVVSGDHFSLVKPENTQHDAYQLIIKTLTENTFLNEFTNKEEINLTLGNYDSIVKELLPKKSKLRGNALRQLIFALEGLDRKEEVIELLENHKSLQEKSQLLGLLGGRLKREYLLSYDDSAGERAYDYYHKALTIALDQNDYQEMYYHAINLAFLSLVYKEDKAQMRSFAQIAMDAVEEDPIDSLWKQATIAEASLYLGNLDKAQEYYKKAASGAGIREKISMHTNALMAYSTLMDVDDDAFITFLKQTFLF